MKKLLLLVAVFMMATTGYSQLRNNSPLSNQNLSAIQLDAVSTVSNPQLNQLVSKPINNPLGAKAACIDTLLYEDFQSETIPATWTNIDVDGAVDANARPLDWFISFDAQTTVPGDTNYVATSSSWFSPAGTANNWLILDAINPCLETTLNWLSAPFEGPTFADGYKVMISTTGTAFADFTDVVFTHAESVNGTATQSAGSVHTSYNGTNGILQEWSVDLSAYDNQTIYIAFVHDSNDDNLIMIDNIFAGVFVSFDLEVVSTTQTPSYYSTPIDQVQPLIFTGDVSLSPGGDVTQPELDIEIFQNTTSVYTNNPSLLAQVGGTTETYTATAGFTPTASDSFTVAFEASAVEVDPDLTNNVDTSYFIVNDSVYATEDGNFDGALGIGAGTSGFLGNMYEVVVTDDLTSVTFFLSTPTLGDTVVCQVYDMLAGAPNQLVAATDTLFITNTTAAEYTLQIIGGSVNLVPGFYIVGVLESNSANVSIATNTEFYEIGRSWVFFSGAWGNNEDFGFPNTYLIRANFGPLCTDPVSGYTTNVNTLTIDCTDTSTTIGATSWLWDFGDGNTSTMQNPSHTYTASGTYTVCLTVTDDCGTDSTCTFETVLDCSAGGPNVDFNNSITGTSADFTDASTTTGTTTWLWDFGDGTTSTDQNPSTVYSGVGTYAVCLTVTDDCGTDSTCMSVNISDASIGENGLAYISVYPVPANDYLTVGNLHSNEQYTIELVNSIGQTVGSYSVLESNETKIALSTFAKGVYQVRIKSDLGIDVRPILIVR